MKVNDVLRKGEVSLRVLAMKDDICFCINCSTNFMPVWMPMSTLDEYTPDTAPMSDTNLTAKQKQVAHERYTMIAPMLAFLTDDKERKEDRNYDAAAAYVKKHLNRSEDRKQMTAVLEEVGRGLQEKCPYCRFWGISIHQDEPNGTSHLDIRYTIFTDGEKTGLGKRVTMNKGLAKMGFKSDKERTALQKFQDAIKADIQAGMEARGYERDCRDNHEKHVSTSVYQAQKDKEKAIAEKEKAEALVEEIKKREADLQRREREQQELIVLGRRAKAQQLADGLVTDDSDHNITGRELPNF